MPRERSATRRASTKLTLRFTNAMSSTPATLTAIIGHGSAKSTATNA